MGNGVKAVISSVKAEINFVNAELKDEIEDVVIKATDELSQGLQCVNHELSQMRAGALMRDKQNRQQLREELQFDIAQLRTEITDKIDKASEQHGRHIQQMVEYRARDYTTLEQRIRVNEQSIARIQRGELAV